ncbi:MAG: aldehyde oxidase [Acholeplasmatales bacterium]|nr:MAG: aldehyde oxidase [Acholeplasmatales bacterium]
MKVVNQYVPSVDGKGIMLGRPAYTDDLAAPDALIVKVLRSPHAFAKIVAIDTQAAEALEGVELVLTHKNVPRKAFTRAGQGYPEPSPHDKFVLDTYVRYVGDEVAAVAAIDEKTAQKALGLIVVQYEVLEPVLDFESAIDHASIIHPEEGIREMFPTGFEPKRNIAAAYDMHVGNVEASLASCDVVVRETFHTQAQAHAMMEPHTVNARMDYQDRLLMYSSTQTPFHVRRILSQALDVPISRIRVIKPRVGGGFGGKQALHGEMLVALTTLRTRKPAKMVFTRQEVFESSYSRHPMRIDIALGAMKDGTLKAIDCRILSDTGAYGEHALTVFMVAGSKVLPLYNKVDAVRFGGQVVYTNKTPAGAYRGYGAIQGNFALESAVDMLCERLEIDPIVFRRKNMIAEGESSPIFEIMGEGTEGTAMSMETCKLDTCVSRGLTLIDWHKKYPRQTLPDGRIKSVGMAIAMQGSGIPYIDMGAATIKLNDDGFYNLMVGATDIGQGSDTILTQIAAEVLMTTVDRVIVYSSDSDLTPFDAGAYASSTTYVSGNAVLAAAEKMKGMLLDEAARALGCDRELVRFDGATFTADSGENISLSKLSNRLYYNEDQQQLTATASYVGTKSPPPFMAGLIEIDLDPETGEIDIVDYVSVVDCGTAINPKLAIGQIEGGIVQGLGMAHFEAVKYTAQGRLISNDFLSYKIPTQRSVKNLQTEIVHSYEPSGPFGAKSVGEIGIDTPPAALANAVYNATGVRITSLPITAEKIMAGIAAKKGEQSL